MEADRKVGVPKIMGRQGAGGPRGRLLDVVAS